MVHELRNLGRVVEDGDAGLGQRADQHVDLVLGADIDAARRDRRSAAPGSAPATTWRWRSSADCRRRRRRRSCRARAGAPAGRSAPRRRRRPRPCGRSSLRTAKRSIIGDRGVGAARQPEEERLCLAILRHHADARAHRIGGRCDASAARPPSAMVPLSTPRSPKSASNSSALAHALQRAYAEHFAGPELEGEIVQRATDAEPLAGEGRPRGVGLAIVLALRDRSRRGSGR